MKGIGNANRDVTKRERIIHARREGEHIRVFRAISKTGIQLDHFVRVDEANRERTRDANRTFDRKIDRVEILKVDKDAARVLNRTFRHV